MAYRKRENNPQNESKISRNDFKEQKMNTKTSKSLIVSLALIFALLTVTSAPIQGDDREIFSASTMPYIMFILDNSGSMWNNDFYVAAADDAEKKADFETYTTSTGKTYTFSTSYESSYDAYFAYRIIVLKRVTIELVDVFRDEVLLGLSHFFYEGSGSKRSHGALVFAEVQNYSSGDTSRDTLLDAITDYIYTSVNADYYTPLAESLDTAYGYFAGLINSSDGNMWTNMNGKPRIPEGSTAPDQYSCQNTFLILITDGYPTADDFGKYSSSSLGYQARYTGTATTDLPTMADWIFEHPISPAASGIVTYTVGMKMSGSGETLLQTTADMEHGRGKYFPGNDYSQLKDSLLSAIHDILQRNFAFSAYTSPKKLTTAGEQKNVSFSGYFLNQPEGVSIWEGHLECLEIEEDGDTYKFTKKWDAADEMPAHASRKLWTAIPEETAPTFQTLNFVTTEATKMVKSMNAEDSAEVVDTVNYIRGDRPASEPENLLADLFHSEISYLGSPPIWKKMHNPTACNVADPENDENCYEKFYIDNEDRKSVIFAGTNDGVFHCFDGSLDGSEKGQELWGFVPDEVMPKLREISVNKNYTYTVDGNITIDDIYTGTSDFWRTIAIFGLREGGEAYYCLDVTDPDPAGYPPLKWKFPAYNATGVFKAFNPAGNIMYLTGTNSTTAEIGDYIVNQQRTAIARITNVAGGGSEVTIADATGTFTGETADGAGDGDRVLMLPSYAQYIGESWAKPVITRLKYKKGTSGAIVTEWVVILSGGFNSDADAGHAGKSIFILNAWTGEPIWYFAFDDGMSGYDGSGNIVSDDSLFTNDENHDYPVPRGFAALDLDSNDYTDTLFFGNTGGNFFRLDLSDPLTTTWVPRVLLSLNDEKQPIYQAPSVSYDYCYNLWLHFGSGNRSRPQGETGSEAGRLYAINLSKTLPSGGCQLTDLSNLNAYWNASDDSATEMGEGGEQDNPVTLDAGKSGWYFDFPAENEILMEPAPTVIPVDYTPHLYFNTYQPDTTVSSGDPCGTGGNMRLYVIDLYTCGNLISGGREEARIQGGGLLANGEYLIYIGTPSTGSLQQKRIESHTMPFTGGLIFWKEKKR
ncbi:MAG: hypothetical protein GY757_23355 [bacterium]|nr:hypothetical protein [bacterium]